MASQSHPPAPLGPRQVAPAIGRVQVVATHAEPPAGPFPLPFVKDPDSELAVSFRILRHRLRRAGDPRVIAVTSPNPREGKTTCAANLAMALAEHGRDKVMLLEANVRRPRLGEALGFAPPSCFAQQLAAHAREPDQSWCAVAAYLDNLHVLAVAAQSAGTMLLTAPALKLAIDHVRAAGYGYVIIDCPSTLRSADVNVIEDLADGVLLTCMAGTTTQKSLQQAVRHLAPAEILGVVLMNAKR
jgi:Mrp family chromosome partitioning ATPase